jgi:hypothetical protein
LATPSIASAGVGFRARSASTRASAAGRNSTTLAGAGLSPREDQQVGVVGDQLRAAHQQPTRLGPGGEVRVVALQLRAFSHGRPSQYGLPRAGPIVGELLKPLLG